MFSRVCALSFPPTLAPKLTSPGKRIWLRPGKKFLFGRTKAEGANLNYIHEPC